MQFKVGIHTLDGNAREHNPPTPRTLNCLVSSSKSLLKINESCKMEKERLVRIQKQLLENVMDYIQLHATQIDRQRVKLIEKGT